MPVSIVLKGDVKVSGILVTVRPVIHLPVTASYTPPNWLKLPVAGKVSLDLLVPPP